MLCSILYSILFSILYSMYTVCYTAYNDIIQYIIYIYDDDGMSTDNSDDSL